MPFILISKSNQAKPNQTKSSQAKPNQTKTQNKVKIALMLAKINIQNYAHSERNGKENKKKKKDR